MSALDSTSVLDQAVAQRAVSRLWSKTGVNSRGCWVYLSQNARYPRLKVNGRDWQINRLSAIAFLGYGLDDLEAVVMHECDNTRCWNPDHLRVGTQLENILDCTVKGRRRLTGPFSKAESFRKKGITIVHSLYAVL